MADLTIIYYTANVINDYFSKNIQKQLLEAKGDLPLISVSKKPMELGQNICVGDTPRNHVNTYRQATIGAKQARTKYIAMAEDDVLYSAEHFKQRPKDGFFAYNIANWGIYSWTNPPVFSWKGRKNLFSMICERELFIEAMEERFAMYPLDKDVPAESWAEPGKYEGILGITIRKTQEFYTNPPNIVFSHEEALAFGYLGTRKKLGDLRAVEIPYWGTAEKIMKLYKS